jgi:hypothetical protein
VVYKPVPLPSVAAGDLFDGSLLLQDVGAELWEVERAAGPKLTVMWGTDLDDFDPATQVSTTPLLSLLCIVRLVLPS